MIRAALILLNFLLIAGCATPEYNYAPQSFEISEPPLGSINVAYVGDNMLRQGTYEEHDAIRLDEEVKVGIIGTYRFTPGHYLKEGQEGDVEYYNPSNTKGSGSVIAGAITDPFEAMMVYTKMPTLSGVSTLNGKVCKNNVEFVRFKQPILTSDSFQQTLIYSGQVGDKINIGYRESSGNVARPAFHNDVEYDLSESTTIGYKGALLEIIEATNQHIKYKVVRNFNAAAF